MLSSDGRGGSSESYFINKTGYEMFDVTRAFGLALSIEGLTYEGVRTRITDWGRAFAITVTGTKKDVPDPQLFADDSVWQRVFATHRERKDSKKSHPKEDIKRILTDRYEETLSEHSNPLFNPKIGRSIADGRTFYQSMDISAAKGLREEKKSATYSEGTQLLVDPLSWAVSCLGHAFFVSTYRPSDFILTLVPNPSDIQFLHHRQIKKDLDSETVCRASAGVALAHYATKLVRTIALRKDTKAEYESVVYNLQRRTGQQPKPSGGGRYGLDFLVRLACQPRGVDALAWIDRTISLGWRKGIRQDMASSLSDLIGHPDATSLKRFASLSARAQAKGEASPWEREVFEEVIRNVKHV